MAEDEGSLDEFFASKPAEVQQSREKSTNSEKNVSLEDEFAKLLNDFINQDTAPSNITKNQEPVISQTTTNTENLDAFISNDSLGNKPISQQTNTPIENTAEKNTLKTEEMELSQAINRFQEGMNYISNAKNLKLPKTDYNKTMLQPNYKPSVGKIIAQYLVSCWDIVNKYDPENMKRLSPTANDEEYLTFAETLNDTSLQLVIISYVEILINIEICEVKYKQKKEIAVKNRIKKELYEEYQKLQERKQIFIRKLKEKNFPIDVDRLINNYFRAAQKDSKGAFEALTKNPATFSPIEFEKLHTRFFGLIKVTPEDGIKANQKIGKFIKKLKV